jgi:hypothetical protein
MTDTKLTARKDKPRGACVVTFRLAGKCQRCSVTLHPSHISSAGILCSDCCPCSGKRR